MATLPDIAWEEVPCPLCGCRQSTAYLRARDVLYGMPGEFQLVRCGDCGHYYLNPRPTPDCIHRFYPKDYGPHHPPPPGEDASAAASPKIEHAGRQPWYLSKPVRWIPGLRRLYYWLSETYAEVIPDVASSPKRALELGCADGGFLHRLQQQGWEAEGIELAADPAQRAQQRGLNVHVGRLEPGMFSAGHFDAVLAWMVIEHLHDPLATLREIRRILKRPGWLAFSVPNFACWERRVFGRYWYALQLPVHLHQFTPKSLRRMLERTGFEDIRVIHQRNLLNVPGSLGLRLSEGFARRLGERLVRFPDRPGRFSQLAMAPLAIILARLGQAGRLTVIARASPARGPVERLDPSR